MAAPAGLEETLARYCAQSGLITADQLRELLDLSRRDPSISIREELVKRGWAKRDFLDRAVEETVSGAAPSITRAFPSTEGPTGTLVLPPTPSENPTAPAPAGGPALDRVPPEVEEARKLEKNRFGKYVLVKLLGSGGMASVYKAWDTLLAQFVALKFIKLGDFAESDPEEGARVREAFMVEARLAVKLNHPHIARVYELGEIAGRPYMSQFYIDGPSLHEVIHGTKSRSDETRFYLDPRRYVSIIRDIADAMGYAHGLTPPIIHRDLKPANVMLDSAGRAYVVDFGLAKEVQAGQTSMSGVVKGTPKYMAPEQADGRSHDMDARTDLWAIGVILYEMLTGRAPFEHENLHRLLSMIVSEEPTWPRHVVTSHTAQVASGTAGAVSIPRPLEAIAMRCLQKERHHRYPSAGELVKDLERFLGGETIEAPKATPSQVAGQVARAVKRKRPIWLPIVAAAFGIALTVAVLRSGAPAPKGSAPIAETSDPRRAEAVQRRDAFLAAPSPETLDTLAAFVEKAGPDAAALARQGLAAWWIDAVQARDAGVAALYASKKDWLDEASRRRAQAWKAEAAFAARVDARRGPLGLPEQNLERARARLDEILAWKGAFSLAADVRPWAKLSLRVDGREIPRDASRQEDLCPLRIAAVPVGDLVLEFVRNDRKQILLVPEKELRDGAVLRIWGTLSGLERAID